MGRPPDQPPRPPEPTRQPQEWATTRIQTPPPSEPTPARAKQRPLGKRRLIALIVLALLVIGTIAAELYARHVASSKVASAVVCEVQDSASVSFAAMPPVLWQYITGHYTDISVQTAGNQVRSAKGMKATVDIRDIRLSSGSNSQGTIGALSGTLTWSTDGIKQSIQDVIPGVSFLVASKVTTNPGDGTVELKGFLDNATVKPQIVNNGLSLQVVSLSAGGHNISTDTVQKDLDDLTAKATQNYPLGVHADSVKVTDSGIEATFSASNATIPASSSSQSGQDCFTGL